MTTCTVFPRAIALLLSTFHLPRLAFTTTVIAIVLVIVGLHLDSQYLGIILSVAVAFGIDISRIRACAFLAFPVVFYPANAAIFLRIVPHRPIIRSGAVARSADIAMADVFIFIAVVRGT